MPKKAWVGKWKRKFGFNFGMYFKMAVIEKERINHEVLSNQLLSKYSIIGGAMEFQIQFFTNIINNYTESIKLISTIEI